MWGFSWLWILAVILFVLKLCRHDVG